MRSRSARFDRVIAGSHTIAERVDVLLNRQVVLSGVNITGGELTFSSTASSRARGMVDVAEPLLLPTAAEPGPLSPYGYELQIWRGVTYRTGRPEQTIVVVGDSVIRITEDGVTRLTEDGTVRYTEGTGSSTTVIPAADVDAEMVSLGIFPIQKSHFDGVTLLGQIDLLDRSQLVADAVFETDYLVAAESNGATAIRAMIEAGVPGLEYAFESSTFLLPAVVFSAGDDRWEAAKAMAEAIGCELYFDGHGRCVLRSMPGTTDPQFTIRDGEGGNLTNIAIDLDRAPAVNRVIAIGENSTLNEVYRGVATDDDPESPTAYDGPFGRKAMVYRSPHIQSNDQASAAARAVLLAHSGVARIVELSAIPNPVYEPGDVFLATCDRMGINELYILDEFPIELGATGLLSTAVNADLGVQTKARFIRTVTADVAPVSTVLTDEGFDDAQAGDALAAGTSSALTVTGSGSATHSDEWQLTGGLSLKLVGTAQHYATFGTYPAHTTHKAMLYLRMDQVPSEGNWFYGLRDGADTAYAGQIGVSATGKLMVRAGGSGAALDTAVSAFTLGATNRLDITWTGLQLTVVIFTGADINSVDPMALDSLTCAVTATDYSNERVGRLVAITATGAVTGNKQNESFDGGTNGAVPSTTNTSADAVAGSGALTLSNVWAADGTLALYVNGGATYHLIRFDSASTTDLHISMKVRMVTNPGANAYFARISNGGATADAAQLGISSIGKLVVRDSNTTTVATSTTTLAIGTTYRIDWTLLGAGGQTVRIYTGATEDSTNTADAAELVANDATLTATNFSTERIGLIAATTGTLGMRIDGYKSDSTALPNGTAASGGVLYIERLKSDSAVMPTPLVLDTGTTPPPPPPGGKLVPTTGALFGVTAANPGTKGNTTPTGLANWVGAVGKRPQIIGMYYTGAWNGVINSELRGMLEPSGGTRAILYAHWKINSGGATWKQVADGARDADIDNMCNGIKQYKHTIFMALPHHEAEDDVGAAGSGMTKADYRAMCQHYVKRCRANGATNLVFVLQFIGYSSWAVNSSGQGFEDFYPGDDYVDWIGWDPYTRSSTRDTWDELINENIAGTSGWPGFYDWAVATHPSKPLMLSEFGVGMADMTAAQAEAVVTNWRLQVDDFPALKALVYWHAKDAGDYQINGTAVADEMAAFVQLPYFNQNMANFP